MGHMLNSIRKALIAVAALAALGLGGAAIAGAVDKNSNSNSNSGARSGTAQSRPALSAANAAKVKVAALAKVPGATVDRTEAGGPYGTPYHAHITTAGGDRKVVLVDSSFKATAVQDEMARGGRPGGPGPGGFGHGGPGGPGGDETPLTGDTKDKVEAAVLDEYAGATILRTETNAQGDAPYESHITTSAGKELEVVVSKDFKVLDALEHPPHP
jgi:hypothetical protein